MRVLLDECLPKRLKSEVEADEVKTVPEVGWASKKNGELPRLAQLDFDVLLMSFVSATKTLKAKSNFFKFC